MTKSISNFLAQTSRLAAYGAGLGILAATGVTAMRVMAPPAQAALECQVPATIRGKVSTVLSGDRIVLSDRRQLRLAGLDIPRGKGASAVQAAERAKVGLSLLVSGKDITFSAQEVRTRAGATFLAAHVFANGQWVQGELVDAGLARVRTYADSRLCAAQLLARETAAREARKGLWAQTDFAIRSAQTAQAAIGGFHLVEGRVVTTAEIGGRVFLNFGADYRSDFTIHVKPEDTALFEKSGLALQTLKGRTVRVRGYVGDRNGPVVTATHPEQLEVLASR